MKRKIFCLLLIFSMMASMMPGMVFGAADSGSAQKYVALGDSIATGYGLSEYENNGKNVPDSYVNIVAKDEKLTAVNLAKDGMTSLQLKELMAGSDMKATLKEAELITVSIGGNDMIQAMYQAIGKELNTTDKTIIMTELMKAASGNGTAEAKLEAAILSVSGNMEKIASEFDSNLKASIKSITNINPDAVIIVQTIANPYQWINNGKLNLVIGLSLMQMNRVITGNADKFGYYVADVNSAFSDSDTPLTNATSKNSPMDPHPNAAGHKVIAGLIEDTYNGVKVESSSYMVATKIKFLAKASKGKVTLTWSNSAGRKMDGYQILKSTKKTTAYKKVCTTSKTKYVNKGGVKAGKTYYYKIRGFKTMYGEKIYTNYSVVKVVAR